MSDLILWDEDKKEFSDVIEINYEGFNNSLRYVKGQNSKRLYVGHENFTIHKYIGKKDIEGEKIYADSSIVEFEIVDESGVTKLTGMFVWNDIDLRYEIDISKGNEPYVCLNYDDERMSNFNIIDTIQENKLGLIK